MKFPNRQRLGEIALLSMGLLLAAGPCFAQYDGQPGSSGAYGEFDLGSTRTSTAIAVSDVGVGSGANHGTSGNTSYKTNEAPAQKTQGDSKKTGNQHVQGLPRAGWMALDRVFGHGMPLPPTVLDSFVKTAAGNADLIYGDEGTTSIPPFFDFDESHRIERGIYSPGLTTGHWSPLPEAWGWPN